MFDRSRTRFHDKNLQKSGAIFSLRRVASFYYREIHSSMVCKYKQKTKNKDLKSFGSAANQSRDQGRGQWIESHHGNCILQMMKYAPLLQIL